MMKITYGALQFAGRPAARPRFGEMIADGPKLTISQKKNITESAVRVLRQRIAEDQPKSPVASVPITVTPFSVQREASVGYPKQHREGVGDFIAGIDGMVEHDGSSAGQEKRNFKFYPDVPGDPVHVINVRV